MTFAAKQPAAADRGLQAIGTSPLFIDARLAPGESRTFPIMLSAGDDSDITVRFEHADFGFQDDGYSVRLIEDSESKTVKFSTRGWFSTPQDSYEVEANQTMVVPLTIEVPKDARPGTHLGAALFSAVPRTTRPQSTAVVAVPRSGPLVFVAVKGGSRPKPEISRFRVNRLGTHGPIRPEIEMTNDGSVHYKVSGEVTLDGDGVTDSASIPTKYVMPDRPRTIVNGSSSTSAAASASTTKITLGERQLPPGRYTVEARLTITPDNIRIVDTRTVWIIPWWLRGVILLGILTLAAAIALIWRRIREQQILRLLAADDADLDQEDTADESDADPMYAAADDSESDDSESDDPESDDPESDDPESDDPESDDPDETDTDQ